MCTISYTCPGTERRRVAGSFSAAQQKKTIQTFHLLHLRNHNIDSLKNANGCFIALHNIAIESKDLKYHATNHHADI